MIDAVDDDHDLRSFGIQWTESMEEFISLKDIPCCLLLDIDYIKVFTQRPNGFQLSQIIETTANCTDVTCLTAVTDQSKGDDKFT